jgi:hypothetical protein
MNRPVSFDFKLFCLMLILGSLFSGFGILLVWAEYNYGQVEKNRANWARGEALLQEIGINYFSVPKNTTYKLTVNYIFHKNGRDYQGTAIAGGYSSHSAKQIISLIVPFVPAAGSFNPDGLSFINSQHTWLVPLLPVPVIYNPIDPANVEMVLKNPIKNDIIGTWFRYPFIFIILLTGLSFLFFAWPAAQDQRYKNV